MTRAAQGWGDTGDEWAYGRGRYEPERRPSGGGHYHPHGGQWDGGDPAWRQPQQQPVGGKVEIDGVGGFSSITLRDCDDGDGQWTPRAAAAADPQHEERRPPHRRSLIRRQQQPAAAPAPPLQRVLSPGVRPGADIYAGRYADYQEAPTQRRYSDQRPNREPLDEQAETDMLLSYPIDRALAAAPWLRRRFLAADPDWQRTLREAWPHRPPWLSSLLRQLWLSQAAPPPAARPPLDSPPAEAWDARAARGGYDGYSYNVGASGYNSYHRARSEGRVHSVPQHSTSPLSPLSASCAVGSDRGWDSDHPDQPRRRQSGVAPQRSRSRGSRGRSELAYAYPTQQQQQQLDGRGSELATAGPQCCNYKAPVCADGCSVM